MNSTKGSHLERSAERSESRLRHWRQVIVSACEQSGRARVPDLAAAAVLEVELEAELEADLAEVAEEEVPAPEEEDSETFVISDVDDTDEPVQTVTVAGATADPVKDYLKQIGMNVELQEMDWNTLAQRRTKADPVDKGGWSIFHNWWLGTSFVNPAISPVLRGLGAKGWAGWFSHAKIEELTDDVRARRAGQQ